MKQTMKRMSCLLLAVCLLMALAPVSAQAAEEKQGVDFVLVLDCSGSMAKNDTEGLAATACKELLDFMPIENARIGVIAYGYNGEKMEYRNFTVEYDRNLVHVLSGLSGSMTVEEKDALKSSISSVTGKVSSDPTSAIGQGLAAGVDMLLEGGATDGNACVILLSDGGATSAVAYDEAIQLAKSVPGAAKEHNWPIFCIELTYGGYANANEQAENHKRLESISSGSGEGALLLSVSSPAEVSNALLTIYDHFMDTEGKSETIIIGDTGEVTTEFEVPELTSETNLLAAGKNVDYVELTNPKGVTRKITKSETDGRWVTNVETDEYIAVKVSLPEPGTWTLKAVGDPKASVHVHNTNIRELDLELLGNPAPGRVTKNDTVSLRAYFTYHGSEMDSSSFYAENQADAKAHVVSYDASGTEVDRKTYDVTGDTNGFLVQVPVSEIPTGTFSVQVVLKNDMFRTGEKSSTKLTYASENLPLTLVEGAGALERRGYVNGEFEAVNLADIFHNPDGDAVEYVLSCPADPTVSFEHTVTEAGMLEISAGMKPGTYQMRIAATDPDMTEPLVYDGLTLTVENRAMEVSKIKKQEVWVDYYDNLLIHQDPTNTVLDIDLNNYYSDPDGVTLTFGDITADTSGLVNAYWQEGKLHVEPLAEGNVVLKTTVSDGVDTLDAEIQVKVVSGKAIYWATHWFYYAIAVGILVALILVYLYVKAHTTMKGSWKVTIKKGYDSIATKDGLKMKTLNTVKKAGSKPFLLKDLVNETMKWMPDQNGLKTTAAPFLGDEAFASIKLQGIYSGLGFMVLNVPGGDVEVEYNSQVRPKGKKFRVTTGELRVSVKRQSAFDPNDTLTILLENTGK